MKQTRGSRPCLGVVSDTHGEARSELLKMLQGVEGILHAGDVGSLAVVRELETIAPVTAVRGNMDPRDVCAVLPEIAWLKWRGLCIAVVHRLTNPADRSISPADYKDRSPDVVVFGHTHRAEIYWHEGCLYFNPGSAGSRRFGLPCTAGLLSLDEAGRPQAQVLVLER